MESVWATRGFHAVMFVLYLYGCIFHLNIQREKFGLQSPTRFGSWKFLTYWNLLAQTIFFGIMTVIDFLPSNSTLRNKLRSISHPLCSGICVPFAIFVFTSFWSLYLYDRDLIFPKILEKVYPVWLNHLSHTLICPAILLECYLNCHTCGRKSALPLFLTMGLGYMIWVFFLGFSFDIWVYPVLYKLNFIARMVFMGGSAVVLVGFFLLGEKLVKVLSRSTVRTPRTRKAF